MADSSWVDAIEYDRLVYRVGDRDSEFSGHTPELRRQECRLAQAADLVVYSASSLEDYVEALGPRRSMHLPNGVDYEHFARALGRLHEQAVEGRLRGMAPSEARLLAEPEPSPVDEDD